MCLAVVGISANFWGFPVYILDEAKNAACAWEMFQRGDWVTPTFNGQLRTDKPPLHYFFMILSFKAFGVSAWSARLFSVIMGCLTVAVVYYFTRKLAGERVAFLSGLVLVSSLFVILEFHLAVPDPYFIFFLTLSWLSFAYAWESGVSRYYYASYAAVALAFMAKGPAAVALSGATFLLFMVLRGEFRWSVLLRIKFFAGALIFLILTVPWWVAVTLTTHGEWVRGFIWEHNVGRFAAAYEDHANFPGMVILLLFVAMLPLSGYLPRALYRVWIDRRREPLLFMAAVSVAVVVVFFSVSRTLLPNYVGPAIPMAAILIGWGMDRHLGKSAVTSSRLRGFAVVMALLLSSLVPVLREIIAGDRWIKDLSSLSWLFVPLSLGPWIAAGFIWANQLRMALISYLLGFWLTGVLFFFVGAPQIFTRNPVSRSLEMVRGAREEVIAYRFFNAAYVFNLERTFLTFWDMESLRQYCAGRTVMILSRDEDRQTLEAAGFRIVFEYPYLFEGSTALVLTNRTE